MAKEHILAVDIGTSSIKAGLVDDSGHLSGYVHQPLLLDGRSFSSWNPLWWDAAFAQAVQNLGGGHLLECSAVVISGNGPTLVALDAKDQVLGSALLWMEPGMERLPGEASFFLPKVRAYRKDNPAFFGQTAGFLSCPEYLYWRLGGNKLTICPPGAFRSAYWDSPSLAQSGLEPSLFPPFCDPGDFMGRSNDQAPKLFGIPSGIPLYAGGSDFLMSLAGTACLEPGMVCDRAGSSEGLNLCSSAPLRQPGIRVLPHLQEGLWNNAAILGTTGLMFEWFRGLTGQKDRPYGDMMQEISALDDYRDQPFFLPRQEAGGGRDFSTSVFVNLAPRHGAIHLARAVVESIGFSVRRSMEVFREGGAQIHSFRVSGGQAKNREWNQMKSDILGIPIEIPAIRDAELAGNALTGFTGMGRFASLAEAAKFMVHIEETLEPDPKRHQKFTARYQDYRALEARAGCLFSE